MTLDLDKLEALERAATSGPWQTEPPPRFKPGRCGGIVGPGSRYEREQIVETDSGVYGPRSADAALIVELRNAAPALLASARMLGELAAKLPRCAMPGCGKTATRCDSNCFDVCDDNGHGAWAEPDGFNYDLPWADIIRRRNAR